MKRRKAEWIFILLERVRTLMFIIWRGRRGERIKCNITLSAIRAAEYIKAHSAELVTLILYSIYL